MVAGVVSLFSYNVTMTLGRCRSQTLILNDALILHRPLVFMLAAFGAVILLASRKAVDCSM